MQFVEKILELITETTAQSLLGRSKLCNGSQPVSTGASRGHSKLKFTILFQNTRICPRNSLKCSR